MWPPEISKAIDTLADYGVQLAQRSPYPYEGDVDRLRMAIAGSIEVQFTEPDYELADLIILNCAKCGAELPTPCTHPECPQ